MDEVVRVDAAELERLALRVLEGLGTPADLAAVVAGSLVAADLAGHGSHGVRRLEPYAAFVRSGQIVADARASVETADGATAVVDGHYGFGQPAARRGSTSPRSGPPSTARRSSRSGGATTWAGSGVRRRARPARPGRLGLLPRRRHRRPVRRAGAPAGHQPDGLGGPGGRRRPAARARLGHLGVGQGKLAVARARGEQVPPDVLVDAAGAASTDPQDFYDGGALLPFGGHKGYALSLMIDVVGGLLTGAGAASLPGYDGTNGTVLVAHDVTRFTPLARFTEQVEALREELHATPPAPGSDGVLLPGEPEEAARRHHLAHGVDVPAGTWAALNDLVPHTAGEQR